jgi:hypothetical protein
VRIVECGDFSYVGSTFGVGGMLYVLSARVLYIS